MTEEEEYEAYMERQYFFLRQEDEERERLERERLMQEEFESKIDRNDILKEML
jgi:hypothetical protein